VPRETYLPSRLDQAIFDAPFIVIDADNAAHTITYDLDAADILNTDGAARAIVGTLRQPLLAIDIDPEDTGAGANAGEVVAEQLLLWADRYGLPWLHDSGRPGHTHLVIKTPPCLRKELQLVVPHGHHPAKRLRHPPAHLLATPARTAQRVPEQHADDGRRVPVHQVQAAARR
jgi:hypothetical protein